MAEKSTLTKKLLLRAFWVWEFFSHSTYNYHTLQGTAFGHALSRIFRRLYPNDPQKAAEKTQKHMGFFNTEPCYGLLIHGVTIHLEEKQAQGAPVSEETIESMKTNLMGPLAGFGDAISQGMIVPLSLALSVAFVLHGALWPPIAYVVCVFSVLAAIGYVMWMRGYEKGPSAISHLLSAGKAQRLVSAAKLLGSMILGGLLAQCIILPLPVLLSGVSPLISGYLGCAAATLVSLLLYALQKKVRPNPMIYALVILGGICGALGVFPARFALSPHPVSLWQCLLLGLCYFLSHSSFTTCVAFVTISRPIWSGFVVGLVLGDVALGCLMGAYLQLMYLCFIGVGGAMPTDLSLAGYGGIAVSMALGLPAESMLALCFLFGRLGSYLWPLRMKWNAKFSERAVQCAQNGDYAGITRWHVFASQGALASVTILPCALLIYLLPHLLPAAAGWPLWLLSAMYGASVFLPCVGVASNLRSLTTDKHAWPFFFAGILLHLIGLDLLWIAVLSLPAGYFIYRKSAQKS